MFGRHSTVFCPRTAATWLMLGLFALTWLLMLTLSGGTALAANDAPEPMAPLPATVTLTDAAKAGAAPFPSGAPQLVLCAIEAPITRATAAFFDDALAEATRLGVPLVVRLDTPGGLLE